MYFQAWQSRRKRRHGTQSTDLLRMLKFVSTVKQLLRRENSTSSKWKLPWRPFRTPATTPPKKADSSSRDDSSDKDEKPSTKAKAAIPAKTTPAKKKECSSSYQAMTTVMTKMRNSVVSSATKTNASGQHLKAPVLRTNLMKCMEVRVSKSSKWKMEKLVGHLLPK